MGDFTPSFSLDLLMAQVNEISALYKQNDKVRYLLTSLFFGGHPKLKALAHISVLYDFVFCNFLCSLLIFFSIFTL